MKSLVTFAALIGLVLAADLAAMDINCPTITREMIAPQCSEARACQRPNCMFVTTVDNPCGCPASIPTATLLAPCNAACPYNGCSVEFRSQNLPCEVPTTTVRPPPPPPPPTSRTTRRRTTTSSTTSSTRPVVTVSVTTLPRPSPTCPTVTRTTQPADCPVLRCPVPNCTFQENLSIPCGCSGPRTVLYVQGCPTACPGGCITRTNTISAPCATA